MKILVFAILTSFVGLSVGTLYMNRNIPLHPGIVWSMVGIYAVSIALLEAMPW